MELTGKNVVVTGGARGMGKMFAAYLKNLGAKPYIVDVIQENLDALKSETGIPGQMVDVSNEKSVETFFENYTLENGAPDVLINNACITADALFIKQKGGDITKFPFSNWEKVINVSSISRAGNTGQTNYSATKSAVDAMTVTWAKELSRYGIRVGAIAPGYINTEMVAKIRPDVLEKVIQNIPMGRLGEMEEITQAVQFIIRNDFFTGRILEVDGGMRI